MNTPTDVLAHWYESSLQLARANFLIEQCLS